MNWSLPDEGLSEGFFDDFLNSLPDIDIDCDEDTTDGAVEDWKAKFQHLEPPPMDGFTSLPAEFTSSWAINTKLSPVGTTVSVLVSSSLLPSTYYLLEDYCSFRLHNNICTSLDRLLITTLYLKLILYM